jgi:hypothetical protein
MRYLSIILNYWIFFSFMMIIATSSIFVPGNNQIRIVVVGINILSMLGFYLLVKQSMGGSSTQVYNENRLSLTLGAYSFLFLFIFKSLYYYETDSFFEFSARDSLEYHEMALWMTRDGNLFNSVTQYIDFGYFIDDLGATLIISLAYLIYPSTITFNVVNILAGILTARALFRIAKYYTDRKFAYVTSLTYGLSSFTIYFFSTGMKETFFVMLIVLSFEKILLFHKTRSWRHLFRAIPYSIAIFFFRPVVLIMLIISIYIGLLLSKKKHLHSYLVLIGFTFGIILVGREMFAIGNSVSISSEIVAQKQNLIPNVFNYSSALLASIAGPLPSYLPTIGREQQAFYSTGLGFRLFISGFFLLGLAQIKKVKDPFLMAIGIFTLLEMISLAIILESFELRYSMVHIPFVYLIAFYYLHNSMNTLSGIRQQILLRGTMIIGSLLILGWNIRF